MISYHDWVSIFFFCQALSKINAAINRAVSYKEKLMSMQL